MKPFKVAHAYGADLQEAYDYFQRGGQQAADRFFMRYKRARKIVQKNPLACRLRPTG